MILAFLTFAFGLWQVLTERYVHSAKLKFYFGIIAICLSAIPLVIQSLVLISELVRAKRYFARLLLHRFFMNVLGDHGPAVSLVANYYYFRRNVAETLPLVHLRVFAIILALQLLSAAIDLSPNVYNAPIKIFCEIMRWSIFLVPLLLFGIANWWGLIAFGDAFSGLHNTRSVSTALWLDNVKDQWGLPTGGELGWAEERWKDIEMREMRDLSSLTVRLSLRMERWNWFKTLLRIMPGTENTQDIEQQMHTFADGGVSGLLDLLKRLGNGERFEELQMSEQMAWLDMIDKEGWGILDTKSVMKGRKWTTERWMETKRLKVFKECVLLWQLNQKMIKPVINVDLLSNQLVMSKVIRQVKLSVTFYPWQNLAMSNAASSTLSNGALPTSTVPPPTSNEALPSSTVPPRTSKAPSSTSTTPPPTSNAALPTSTVPPPPSNAASSTSTITPPMTTHSMLRYNILATSSQDSFLSSLYAESFLGHCTYEAAVEFCILMEAMDDDSFVVKGKPSKSRGEIFSCERLGIIVESILRDQKNIHAEKVMTASYV